MIYILPWTTKKHFQATTFKVEEDPRTFQARTSPKIQGLFKAVQTLSLPISLC